MTFLWPQMLWLLLLVPAAVALYVLVLRRKKREAVRFPNLALVRTATGRYAWRRHLPPALLLVALATMIAAAARPAAVVTLPSHHETVILAIDVSGSMRATDVEPTRLEAAQAAARSFIAEQPRGTRIGIVEFSGSASIVQPPTADRRDLEAAIARLQPQHATAVGAAILASLKAVFPDIDFDVQRGPPLKPVPPGSYGAAAVILLTDGQTTAGPDPVEAARLAAERGVRVFTVGVGTEDGQILTGEGWSMRVRLDEDALRAIADLTRGEYFHAGTADDLKRVYEGLHAKLVMERQETEITALFSLMAAVTVLVSAALSLLWFNRIL